MFRRSLIIATLALAAFALFATFGTSDDAEAQGPPEGWSLPSGAREVAPNVWALGTSVSDGVLVEGYAFVHPAAGHAKPPGTPGGKKSGSDSDSTSCYSFIANGAIWRSAEEFVFDLTGSPAGNESVFEAAFGIWNSETSTDIGWSGKSGSGLSIDTSSTDGLNELYFGTISEPGVLGVTIVWYTRGGPPSSRQIVESDMLIDTEWNWRLVDAESEGFEGFDLLAVVLHEAGHYNGLGHADGSDCTDETMAPYINEGDGSKQSLGDGDKAGIAALYGS